MKEKVKRNVSNVLLTLGQTMLLVGITVFAVLPVSCKVTTEGIEIIGGNYTAPVIENVYVVDEKTVVMEFSEEVTLSNVVVSPFIPGISDSLTHSADDSLSPAIAAACGEYGQINASVNKTDDEKKITIIMEKETEIGRTYEIYGCVKDRIGNTLTFCLPFVGFNSKLPKVIMTEVQIKYQKGTSKGEVIYRGEFVECLALEEGNLAGLELISASDGLEKKYVFPAEDVKKGEIILVHLRNIGEGCINEDGIDFDMATAPHSKDGIRDLWSESTVAHFNDTSDVIMLKNTVDGSIMDALMYAGEGMEEWKSSVADAAVKVYEAGIYANYDISSASCSKGTTPLKSLVRENSAELYDAVMNNEEIDFPIVSDDSSWIVTAVSPGML